MLRNIHVTRFGHPLSRHGARYHVSDIEGLEQAAFDINLARIVSQGHITSHQEMFQLLEDTHQARLMWERMIQSRGIPEVITTLFSASTKRDVERIARTSIINENELFLLVHNHSQISLTHRSKFPDFVPEHLQITENDQKNIKSGVLGKLSRKFSSLFTFRKLLHVHMFESDKQWHCIYFDYGDINETGVNRWRYGPHIHYVSYMWPQIKPHQVWEGFDKRKGRVSKGVHIRFRPFEFITRSLDAERRSVPTTEIFFPVDPALLESQNPTPPAQIMTRGAWTADIIVPVDL